MLTPWIEPMKTRRQRLSTNGMPDMYACHAILDVSNLQPASEGRIMVHNDLCSDLSDPTRINSKGAPAETPTSRQVLNP